MHRNYCICIESFEYTMPMAFDLDKSTDLNKHTSLLQSPWISVKFFTVKAPDMAQVCHDDTIEY